MALNLTEAVQLQLQSYDSSGNVLFNRQFNVSNTGGTESGIYDGVPITSSSSTPLPVPTNCRGIFVFNNDTSATITVQYTQNVANAITIGPGGVWLLYAPGATLLYYITDVDAYSTVNGSLITYAAWA